MRVYTDPAFTFMGTFRASVCRLDVYVFGGIHYAVATELNSNPGQSITNASERLWEAVRREISEQVPEYVRLEHYCDESYDFHSDETITRIEIDVNDARSWWPFDLEQYHAIILDDGGKVIW